MRKFCKFILFPFVSIVVFSVIGDLCQKQTKGFRLQKILAPTSFEEPIPLLSKEEQGEIESILKQPFTFMKKGQQCFAFLSADRKYVLKFFRWDKLQEPYLTKFLPTSISTRLSEEKKRKREADFLSYRMAVQELKEETGLIYMQFGQTKRLNIPLIIYDNIGVRHTLSANSVGFILQKRADDFNSFFKEKLASGNEKDLLSFFSAFMELLENRIIKKIADSDISLEHNMGVLEGKPVLFDIGNLKKADSSLEEQAKLVLISLKKYAPYLACFLEEKIQRSKDLEKERAQ